MKQLKEDLTNNSGFSLIEVMVALVITSIILGMVYASYKSIVRSVISISGYAEFYENLNLTISKLDRDISNAYIRRNNKLITFIGAVEGENSSLNFVTVNHNDFMMIGDIKKPAPVSDIKEIAYYLVEDSEYPGMHFLMKREEKHYDDEPEKGGEENILLENVLELKFEYKQGNSWNDNWDSRNKRRLPTAVKTTILMKNYQNIDEEFIIISRINVKR